MTELPPKTEIGLTQDIDTSSVGLVMIDTSSKAILSCNDAFADVLRLPAAEVHGRLITDFLDDEVTSVATAVLDGIRAGFISSVDGNVDLAGRAGFGVDCWLLALGTDRPRKVAMAGVIPTDGTASSGDEPSEAGFRPPHIDSSRIVLATLDEDWRIIEMAPGSALQLGWPDPRTATVMPQLHELADPADESAVDGSFGRRSLVETPETFTLRLRGVDDCWSSARVTVSPLRGHVPPKYGLVLSLMCVEEPGDAESERVARLEDQLARIRQVVQSTENDAPTASIDLSDLTVRQREIVERLLDGHRVDAIARDLYVSPSTVRNHLSSIFDKLGVTSQSELIELLRDRRG